MHARSIRTTLFVVALAALGGVAAPPPSCADEEALVSPTEFFKGRVVRLEGREIELHYDFEDPAQLADWESAIPFRQIKDVTFEHEGTGAVRLKGTGSMRHKAIFKEHVKIDASIVPFRNRDFGLAVTEQRESEVFTLYCLYDKYFGLGDNVTEFQNMIIKFIPRDPKVNADGKQDWRYCGSRGQKPEIKRGMTYAVTVERADNESRFTIDDWESKGKEADRDLTTQMVAFYGIKGDIRIDDVTIVGTLDPEFVSRHHLDLTPITPTKKGDATTETTPEPVLDEATAAPLRQLIAEYPTKTKPLTIARLLRDTTVPLVLRQEAVERIREAGKLQIVPYLLDGLTSSELDVRTLSFAAYDAVLAKKAFGYRPDASDSARDGAMKKINKYIQQHVADFQ